MRLGQLTPVVLLLLLQLELLLVQQLLLVLLLEVARCRNLGEIDD
jgi:hypothetical protein